MFSCLYCSLRHLHVHMASEHAACLNLLVAIPHVETNSPILGVQSLNIRIPFINHIHWWFWGRYTYIIYIYIIIYIHIHIYKYYVYIYIVHGDSPHQFPFFAGHSRKSHEDFTQTIHPEAVRSGEPGHLQKCLMNLFILGWAQVVEYWGWEFMTKNKRKCLFGLQRGP